MTGTFNWNGIKGKNYDLKAVLKLTGPGQWDAVYTFVWKGKNMTYTGVIKGDLANGEVTGTGNPADKSRTFAFKGTAKDGVIAMSHTETTGGKTVATGTGTMKQSQ